MAPLFRVALAIFALISKAEAAIVQRIEITGLLRTHPDVIERELPFAIGDRWQKGFALETEKRLMATGLFSEVRVQPPDRKGVVHIYAHERWTIWIYPFATRKDNGQTTAGVGLADFNAFGRMHQLRLQAFEHTGYNFGQRRQGRGFAISYFWRRVHGSDWDLLLLFGRDRQKAPQGLLTAIRWQAMAERLFGATPEHGWKLALGWNVNDTIELNRLLRRRGPKMRLMYQDIFDHLDWIEGSRAFFEARSALRRFGSSMDALQLLAGAARYRPIDDRGDTINHRIELGFGLGDLQRFGIFDLGHRYGLRGYFPGEAPALHYLLGTIEGRWRLPRAENVQFAAFADAGWLQGPRPGLYLGAGIGFRWIIRWLTRGIARIDAAYGFRIHKWRVYLAVGQAF